MLQPDSGDLVEAFRWTCIERCISKLLLDVYNIDQQRNNAFNNAVSVGYELMFRCRILLVPNFWHLQWPTALHT